MRNMILVIFCVLNVQLAVAQRIAPFRSTTGISGHSGSVTLDGHLYFVQQSVGQQSAIGLFKPGGNVLIQGFIQPNNRPRKVAESSIAASIFPNPFNHHFTIELDEDPTQSADVVLTDIMGRTVYRDHWSDRQRYIVDPGELSPGQYILRISTSKKVYTTKLTKQ